MQEINTCVLSFSPPVDMNSKTKPSALAEDFQLTFTYSLQAPYFF